MRAEWNSPVLQMGLLLTIIGGITPRTSGAANEVIRNGTSVANVVIRAPSVASVGTVFLETTLPETLVALTCGWGFDTSGAPLVPSPQSQEDLSACATELNVTTLLVEDQTKNPFLEDGQLNVVLQIGMTNRVCIPVTCPNLLRGRVYPTQSLVGMSFHISLIT